MTVMSECKATIKWQRTSLDFLKGKYSREHIWMFDGGIIVPASASPSVVPVPFSNPAHVDPEEAFVASISSCHMLTFLYLASKQGFQIDNYEDEAIGVMAKNEKACLGSVWSRSTQKSVITGTNCRCRRMKNSCIIWRTSNVLLRIRSRLKWSFIQHNRQTVGGCPKFGHNFAGMG
jgi:organic hydroperoxide reductase OsmC/OhrA